MKSLITFGSFGWGRQAIQAFKESPATKAIQKSGVCKKVMKKSKSGFPYADYQVPEGREDLVRSIYEGFKGLEKPQVNPSPYEFVKHDLGEDQSKVVDSIINDCFNGNTSFIVQAMAGSGKTYTSFEYILNECFDRGMTKTILGLCFGRANADELQRKCPPRKGWDFRNFHSLAYRAIATELGKRSLQIDNWKVFNKIQKLDSIQELKGGDKADQMKAAITTKAIDKAISLALNCLTDYDNPKELGELLDHYWNQLGSPREKAFVDYDILTEAIPKVIEACLADTSSFTFDEMLYLCVAWDLELPRYEIVMVDEAQDTNPARIAIAKKSLAKGGRIVAIGDKNQNIMGFTGCSSNSMDDIKKEFNCKELNLNTTRRNPGIIAKFVSELFNIDIKCLPGKEKIGKVEELTLSEMNENAEAGDMVLCRKRSDCIDIAISLLNAGKSPIVVGDLSLISDILSTGFSGDADCPVKAFDELQKLEDQEENGDDINKTTMKLLQSSVSMTDFTEKVFKLLGEDDGEKIRIMTCHKSKGLEANNVFCIHKDYSIGLSFEGMKDHEAEQEKNLEYVAYTRSLENLYNVQL